MSDITICNQLTCSTADVNIPFLINSVIKSQSWRVTSFLHHQMRPSASRLEITSCLSQRLCLIRWVSRNTMKCFVANRPEETICCLRARSIHCSLFYFLKLKAGGNFLYIISIFCVFGRISFVQMTGMSFTHFQNKARTRKDFYDRK